LEDWKLALKRRNYLIHQFFFEREMELKSPFGCEKLISELSENDILFDNCAQQVRLSFKLLREAGGIDEDEFSEAITVEMKKLLEVL
jgi:hypothetical protein